MAKKTNPIDELAQVRAHIKALKLSEKALADAVEQTYGLGTHEGVKATATVYESERTTTAWKAIAIKLKASARLISANSETKQSTIVRCTAKLAS